MLKNLFSIRVHVLVVIAALIFACTPPHSEQELPVRWSGSNSLTENFKVRKQKYLRGNLILNNSFESGRIFDVDSSTQSVNIDGWQLLGDDIKWINLQTDSLNCEFGAVYHGNSAIQIKNNNASATDKNGKGVLSDFIKVIPGNYQLNLAVHLQNIENPKKAFGTKIYDAVDIRVIYYDKNKIELNPEQYSKTLKQSVDYSFKGLSFSNYRTIDSTGWIRIVGRSNHLPYNDGDLVDDTRFVRVFIGLKGSGQMWVDDVNFFFTRYNFTMKERISHYLDSAIARYELLSPQPQKVTGLSTVVYYKPQVKGFYPPAIIVPNNSNKQTVFAANLLKSEIERLLNDILGDSILKSHKPEILTRISEEQLGGNRLIFSLGKNQLTTRFKALLPYDELVNKEGGYFIHTNPDLDNLVFLDGNSKNSVINAVLTVQQLFDNKRLLFHNANIIDYPVFKGRALLAKQTPNSSLFENVFKSKIDEIYTFPQEGSTITSPFFNRSVVQSTILTSDFVSKTTSAFNIPANGSVLFVDTLYALVSNISKQKTDKIPYLPDSYLKALNMISERCPKCQIQFYSPWSNLLSTDYASESAEIFFNLFNSQARGGYDILFSGYGERSNRMDDADFLRFYKYTENTPIFLDQTLYPKSIYSHFSGIDSLNPELLPLASLLTPYGNEIVSDLTKYCSTSKVIIDYPLETEMDMLKLMMAAEYYWNPAAYDPDYVLYKLLFTRYGAELTELVLELDAILFALKAENILLSKELNVNKHLRKARILISEYKTIISLQNERNQNNLTLTYSDLIYSEIEKFVNLSGHDDRAILDSINLKKY